MLASHHERDDTRNNLKSSIKVFEASLAALRHGLPAAGVKAPPTAEISAGLEVVQKDWLEVKPTLDEILAGTEVGVAKEEEKFHNLNKTMADMNKVVGMYVDYAKKK